MKQHILTTAAIAALALGAQAQNAMDMLQVTQSQTRGTARFMSMGGAFTALGGDLSTTTQNPAGIGIFRHSEVGATLDINIQNAKAPDGQGGWNSANKTQAACNNFGYIGTARMGSNSVMKNFNWGITYNRLAQFDRTYHAYAPVTETSLSNYIASFTNGIVGDDLNFGTEYDPYRPRRR